MTNPRGLTPYPTSAFEVILLQKSKVAGLRICRENAKEEAIADSYNLSRVTEVAGSVGR